MRRLIVALLVLVTVGATGCASRVNKVMDSWMGHHFSELVASWGPPQQTLDDGDGGRIMVWAADRSYAVPGRATTTANEYGGMLTAQTTYTPAQTHGWKAYRMFWVDRDGRVYKWAWRGL